MQAQNEITKQELDRFREFGYLTVGRLIDFLNEKIESGELSRDSLVLSQRVEDFYFEENEWGVVKKKGDHYNWFLEHNKKIDEGTYLDKEKFPIDMGPNEEFMKKIPDEQIDESIEQYHPVWRPLTYDGDENLYLDLHY